MAAVEEARDLVLRRIAGIIHHGGLNAAAEGVVEIFRGEASRGAVFHEPVVRVVAQRPRAARAVVNTRQVAIVIVRLAPRIVVSMDSTTVPLGTIKIVAKHCIQFRK